MKQDNNIDISKAIAVGLDVLNDPQVKISSNLIEDIGVLKSLLRSLEQRQLVLATPDRILPEGINLSDLKRLNKPKDEE